MDPSALMVAVPCVRPLPYDRTLLDTMSSVDGPATATGVSCRSWSVPAGSDTETSNATVWPRATAEGSVSGVTTGTGAAVTMVVVALAGLAAARFGPPAAAE